MKLLLLIHILMALLITSCVFTDTNLDVKETIPGVYVTEYASQFAKSRDTFAIKWVGKNGYAITRRTYHEYIQRDKPRPPQYNIDHWTGEYSSGFMTVHQNGRQLFFDADARTMKMGVRVYRKL